MRGYARKLFSLSKPCRLLVGWHVLLPLICDLVPLFCIHSLPTTFKGKIVLLRNLLLEVVAQ